jgi:hypothetical protein
MSRPDNLSEGPAYYQAVPPFAPVYEQFLNKRNENTLFENSLSEKAAESAPPSRGRILLPEPESIR